MISVDAVRESLEALRTSGLELGRAPAATITAQLAAIYAGTLARGGITTPAQLSEALQRHLASPERGAWWPRPADLIAAAVGDRKLQIEADVEATIGHALERIEGREFWRYSPVGGGSYDVRAIRAELGVEAAHAFAEAGGSAAFAGDEKERRFAATAFSRALRGLLSSSALSGRIDSSRALAAAQGPTRGLIGGAE